MCSNTSAEYWMTELEMNRLIHTEYNSFWKKVIHLFKLWALKYKLKPDEDSSLLPKSWNRLPLMKWEKFEFLHLIVEDSNKKIN